MKFSNLTITVDSVQRTFLPYDRGQNGAFVWRDSTASVYAPRVVASAATNDAASDKLTVQLNTPRVVLPAEGCCDPIKSLGTDLVKTELRFLATTSMSDRAAQIDRHIALLQELRDIVESRSVIYS